MKRLGKFMISKEMEQFYCSILLNENKEKVRKLKAYGVNEEEIAAAMNEKVQFPHLVVTEDYKVILTDGIGTEIKMEPLVKAVYLLFLSHPEGIAFKQLPDYREELTRIYAILKPTAMTERTLQRIEDVTNPTLNSINEKCARIRAAFVGQFDEYMARSYYVDGQRGEPKKIALSRDLVVWEAG